MADPLVLERTRGALVESRHHLSAVVLDASGRIVAHTGDPDRVAFLRSCAKPMQAVPLLEDGVADRYALSDDLLALACASHSSEPMHLEAAARFLTAIDAHEWELACGAHLPLDPALADGDGRRSGDRPPSWSNCSGKHAGMLALATVHGWPRAGYHRPAHPVQARMREEIRRWAGPQAIAGEAVDGCGVVTFAMTLRDMAAMWGRFAASDGDAATRLRRCMAAHPELVAGTDRLCTDLLRGGAGSILCKVGGDGVYCAALPGSGLALALKVEDGDMKAVSVALLAVLRGLGARLPATVAEALETPAVARHAEPPLRNTRREPVGVLRARGTLRFPD